MGGIAADGLLDLFVDDDVDLDACFCSSLQHLIQSPFLIEEGRSAQEEFGAQPPILNVDGLFGLLERDRDSVEVVAPIDVPLDLVAFSLRSKGFEAVGLGHLGPFVVGRLFMLLIVTVVWVDDVGELANFILEVESGNFGVVEMGIYWREEWSQKVNSSEKGVF